MAPRYLSKEWVDATVEKANADEKYLEKNQKFNTTTWIVATDCPDGNDVSIKYTYEKGKVVKCEYNMAPAPSEYRIGNSPWNESISIFRTQAPYETWVKIQKRELTVMAAMNAKLYVIEGDMMKSIAILANITAFADIQATIPCEY